MKGELDKKLADEIRATVLDSDGFMKLTQVLRRGGTLFRISMRPVMLRDEKKWQAEMIDGTQTHVKNFTRDGAASGLNDILAQTGPRELHLVTATGDIHVRVTKKGKILESRSGKVERVAEVQPHDRVKKQPLAAFDAETLLKAIGIADVDGRIKASMRGKYDQVNEFLKVLDTVIAGREEKTLNIVDCGCGKAYLTFAVHAYLTHVHGYTVNICGIDRKQDVIEAMRVVAANLDVADQVTFIDGDIATAEPPFDADMTISLHACDTATDEALARGMEWKCRYLICAPCCQHELHKALKPDGEFQAVLRHGILRERFADILTDAFRAALLRVLGFRVNVVEFVSSDATARNILLKAEFCVKPGQHGAVSEYLELRDYWKVTPWLETRMMGLLGKYLKRY